MHKWNVSLEGSRPIIVLLPSSRTLVLVHVYSGKLFYFTGAHESCAWLLHVCTMISWCTRDLY